MNSNKQKMLPKYRFPKFRNNEEWILKPLENVLDYERPDNFFVENTSYKKSGTPVLTANKSFILGYTEEDFGIYQENLPVIIFDDFTCDYKFVNFPFKVKSSAIKILKLKNNDNIRFVHGVMSQINFDPVQHKRYYISQYQKLNIPVPHIEEQQKIAACLHSLDELIDAHNEKLTVLQQHKKGLLQHLFPKKGEKVPRYRFKEFKNDGDWNEAKLIDIVDKNIKWSFTGGPFGSNLKASDYTKKGIRIIQLQNIGDGKFNNDAKIFTSTEKADELLSCNIYSGDIIMSKMGDPVGRACIIPKEMKRALMASDGIRIVVDEKKHSKYFIYSLINSKTVRQAIKRKSTGSTRKRIGLRDLKKITLKVPPSLLEQQKIASCLTAVDDLITAQQQRINQLEEHKKGLLQGLFPKID